MTLTEEDVAALGGGVTAAVAGVELHPVGR